MTVLEILAYVIGTTMWMFLVLGLVNYYYYPWNAPGGIVLFFTIIGLSIAGAVIAAINGVPIV